MEDGWVDEWVEGYIGGRQKNRRWKADGWRTDGWILLIYP